MRSIWMKVPLALALLGAAPLALAAGFDCRQASNTAERNICGDANLSALDGGAADAYTQAGQRATDEEAGKLQRDQRNWLAQRNSMLSQYYDSANLRADWLKVIARSYQDRIDFLNRLFQKPVQDAPLLEAIASRLSNTVKANSQTFWKFVGGDGSVFDIASNHRTNLTDVGKEIPVNDAAGLAHVIDDLGHQSSQEGGVTLALLPVAKFGGLYAAIFGGPYNAVGTLYCETWSLFSWDDYAIKPVETPILLQQNCWDSTGTMVTFQGQVYAVQNTFDLVDAEIGMQARVGNNWSKPRRLLVRYDYSLGLPRGYCDNANKDCDALTELAYGDAKRYDRTQYPDALKGVLSSYEKTTFDAMLKVATANAGHQFDDLPTFGATLVGYRSFSGGSDWFPVHWQGKLMLGRISHDGFARRTGDNWYVGIWSWDGKSLSPVAGVAVPVQRSDYLLSVVI